jgi:excisionase family DNA binding protein
MLIWELGDHAIDGISEEIMAERFVTITEIAADLRVSKMTVYRLVEDGELPSLRVGRRSIRVPRDGYEEYLRRQARP